MSWVSVLTTPQPRNHLPMVGAEEPSASGGPALVAPAGSAAWPAYRPREPIAASGMQNKSRRRRRTGCAAAARSTCRFGVGAMSGDSKADKDRASRNPVSSARSLGIGRVPAPANGGSRSDRTRERIVRGASYGNSGRSPLSFFVGLHAEAVGRSNARTRAAERASCGSRGRPDT